MTRFMETAYAPINRSAYQLAAEATEAYEGARTKAQRFINARTPHELIFTKNATEGLNLVAYSWGRPNLRRGDVVVLTHMEHHANVVPWHILAAERAVRASLGAAHTTTALDLSDLDRLLDGAKLFRFTAMRNVLARSPRCATISDAAHAAGAAHASSTAASTTPHNVTDVQAMGRRLLAFKHHKMSAPFRHRRAVGPRALPTHAPPSVRRRRQHDRRRPARRLDPRRFPPSSRPDTPADHRVQPGLSAAIDFLESHGMANVPPARDGPRRATRSGRTGGPLRRRHHHPGAAQRRGPRRHPVVQRSATLTRHDVSQVLDQANVYVRAGHHCAKP
jgi:cysteine desulfurase/selenocysteine lyase